MMFPRKAILYSRRRCCLCDQAKQLLISEGFDVEEVDIDADPELREKYDQCVPVVFIGGRERFRGRIDPVLLRRLLEHPADEPSA
jgi:glutaredoxin